MRTDTSLRRRSAAIGAAFQPRSRRVHGAAIVGWYGDGVEHGVPAHVALANDLEGEPVLFVNGIRLSGAPPFIAVDRLLRNEVTKL